MEKNSWSLFSVLTFSVTLSLSTVNDTHWGCGSVDISANNTCECGTWPMPGTWNLETKQYDARGSPRVMFYGQWQWWCCPQTIDGCNVTAEGNGKCEVAEIVKNNGCATGSQDCHSLQDLCGFGSGHSIYCAMTVLLVLLLSLLM